MTQNANRGSRFIITATSALLILLAIVVSPPGYRFITLGLHFFASFGFAVFAWVGSLCLLTTGLLLFAVRRRITVKELFLVAVSLAGTFLLMEAALAIAGVKPPYRLFPRVPAQVEWFQTNTETGDRYVPGKYPPSWPINSDGHLSRFEFTPENGATAPCRILLLGDSYTFGIGASSYERSFAKLLETMLRQKSEVALWNTGIPGIGQQQELFSLKKYFPMLRPQLVILMFCLNDFEDNFFPLGNHYVFADGLWVLRHAMQPDGTIRTMSPEEAYRRAVRPERPQEYLCTSRVMSLTVGAIRKLDAWKTGVSSAVRPTRAVPRDMDPDACWNRQLNETTRLVKEIARFVSENNARLVLAPIPVPEDLGKERPKCVFDMCRGLGIECLDLGTVVKKSDYLADGHWNDSGHEKVAKRLAEEVNTLLPASPANPEAKAAEVR